MNPSYRFELDKKQIESLLLKGDTDAAFELLAEPLHIWLYKTKDFEKLSIRTPLEQVILGFDYIQSQVGQGGFIQLIQNGYISLLVTVIEGLQELGINTEMRQVLDDVLRVFVLNKELLERETSVEEFGKLYEEFKEFELLEARFEALRVGFEKEIVGLAI